MLHLNHWGLKQVPYNKAIPSAQVPYNRAMSPTHVCLCVCVRARVFLRTGSCYVVHLGLGLVIIQS